MAADAIDVSLARMVMVFRDSIGSGCMAAKTGACIRVCRPGVMGVVAIGAGDTGSMHAALHKRTVDKHLVQNLTVRVVEPLFQHGDVMSVVQGAGVEVGFRQGRSPGMAG